MESIKETELNLQREVVTTVPNTWLVEAVNPNTGEKKMIDIANYASVVAGIIGNPRVMSFSNPPSNNIDEFPSGCEQGMTIFNTGNNFVGLPGSSYFGILMHYQRGVPSLVTESQQVYQILLQSNLLFLHAFLVHTKATKKPLCLLTYLHK